MSKLTPLGHRVVAKQVEKTSKTSSGFYLPEDANNICRAAAKSVVDFHGMNPLR